MQFPTSAGRMLLFVGVVSFGLLVAGSGLSVGNVGAAGDPADESGSLEAWSPAGSSVALAQIEAPDQSAKQKTATPGQQRSADAQSNSPPGRDKKTTGNGNPAAGTNEQDSNNGNSAAGNSGQDSSSAGHQGNPGVKSSGGTPADNRPDSPGAAGNAGNSSDNGSNQSASANGNSRPGSAGPPANDSQTDEKGPPEWVDPSGQTDSDGFEGPPWASPALKNGTSRTVPVPGGNVSVSVARGPPDGTPGERAWVHMENATPNTPIPFDLPAPATNSAVRTEEMSITVESRRNVSLSVSTAPERSSNQTSKFDEEITAEGLGYIDVAHTVPDEEIENVSFRFSVDESRVAPDERGDVALYRYHNGSWNELPTEYVDRNETAFVFEAKSPGLSSFTVGKKVASFQIQQATLLTDVQTTQDPVHVRVRITNTGDADGVFTANLLLDGEIVKSNRLSIAADGTRQTSFEESISEPGSYTVLVNDYTVGTLDVSETRSRAGVDRSDSVATPGTAPDDRSDSEGIFRGWDGFRLPGFGFL